MTESARRNNLREELYGYRGAVPRNASKRKKRGRKFRIRMLVRKVDSNSISKGGSTPGYLQELGFTAPRLKLGSWCLEKMRRLTVARRDWSPCWAIKRGRSPIIRRNRKKEGVKKKHEKYWLGDFGYEEWKRQRRIVHQKEETEEDLGDSRRGERRIYLLTKGCKRFGQVPLETLRDRGNLWDEKEGLGDGLWRYIVKKREKRRTQRRGDTSQ